MVNFLAVRIGWQIPDTCYYLSGIRYPELSFIMRVVIRDVTLKKVISNKRNYNA